MAFASNIAAMNAARQFMKAAGFDASAYKEYFKIEKIDGEWHSQQIQPFPEARDPAHSLMDEREGIFAFPFTPEAEPNALTRAEAEEKEYRDQQAAAEALANAQQAESQLPNGKVWIHASSVPKPTKFVWHVADEMNAAARAAGKPAPSRKEVQDECIRRGVASGTARTQYQAWKKATDDTRANEAKAAELSARFNKS